MKKVRQFLHLYHWQSQEGNVGDDLNLNLWPHLFGDVFREESEILFVGIGSVLDKRHENHRHKIVFGAGARSTQSVPSVNGAGWDLRFVRGPRTASALGLDSNSWISDPAIVAPFAYAEPRKSSSRVKKAVGFVPYFKTPRSYAELICGLSNIQMIPASLKPRIFIDSILKCDALICEAMHAAIIADTYQIPWMPVEIMSPYAEADTHHFKWRDWTESIGLTIEFIGLPAIWSNTRNSIFNELKLYVKAKRASQIIKSALNKKIWYLSNRSIMQNRQHRIMEEVRKLKSELYE